MIATSEILAGVFLDAFDALSDNMRFSYDNEDRSSILKFSLLFCFSLRLLTLRIIFPPQEKRKEVGELMPRLIKPQGILQNIHPFIMPSYHHTRDLK